MTVRTTTVLVAALVALGGVIGVAQVRGQPPQAPQILIESLVGRDSFDLYCASCHGAQGRGNGPVASALRATPADLSALALRNNGAFPRDRVRSFVTGTGRSLAAHGTTEMPVWGPMFRAFESDARVRERIENLVTYVESLQQPSTGPDDPGARAFRTSCASCHGVSARGDGPLAGQLRSRPPDLTQSSARNGGVFPSERLTRIIDGRDVASHGDRTMPVWGDAFRVSPGGLTSDDVDARIAAIVRYLRGIQQRPAE
jgi:mono/diheme cytochrome c family protein